MAENQREYFVYCIENTTRNKFYVGISKMGSGRKRDHFRKLRNDRHSNDYLQHSWNKHGQGVFEYKIIEEGYSSKKELGKAECFWIDILQSMYYQDGYNIQHGGYDAEVADETKEKIRKTVIEKQGRPVRQYTLEGHFVDGFNSITEACDETDINYSSIRRCCANKDRQKTAGGYRWFYENDDSILDIKPLVNYENRKFGKYDLQGNLLNTYNSVNKIAKELDVHNTCIYNCLNNKTKTSCGFQWEYGDKESIDPCDRKFIGQFLQNGCFLSCFYNMAEAADITDSSLKGIWAACNNDRDTHNGFVWRYL